VVALWIVLAHLAGDYLIQSDWMASEKTKRWWPAIAHGVTYTLPYALITQSPWALLVIASTHIVIDHYRLARHVCWFKNQLVPRRFRSSWQDCKATGYPSDKPIWMAVWLMIIADNTMHLIINAFAVVYL
jgi:hypothetical protein